MGEPAEVALEKRANRNDNMRWSSRMGSEKAVANLRKHGVPFETVEAFEWGKR